MQAYEESVIWETQYVEKKPARFGMSKKNRCGLICKLKSAPKEKKTMKSMANLYHRQQTFRKTKAGEQMAKKEADQIVRRNYAIVLKVLHDNFGFGPQRLSEFIQKTTEFAEEAQKDELWFDIVSDWVEKYLGVDFFKEDWMEEKAIKG